MSLARSSDLSLEKKWLRMLRDVMYRLEYGKTMVIKYSTMILALDFGGFPSLFRERFVGDEQSSACPEKNEHLTWPEKNEHSI